MKTFLPLLGALLIPLACGCGPHFVNADVGNLPPNAPCGYVLFYPDTNDGLVLVVTDQTTNTAWEPLLYQQGKAVHLRIACTPGEHTFLVGLPPPPPYYDDVVPATVTVKVAEGFTTPIKVAEGVVGPYETFGDSLFNFFGARTEHVRSRVSLEPGPPRPANEALERSADSF